MLSCFYALNLNLDLPFGVKVVKNANILLLKKCLLLLKR